MCFLNTCQFFVAILKIMKSIFNERLKELREEKGITQSNLAGVFNVSKSTVSGWEVGRNQPNYDMLISIARYFDVSVDYLIGNEDF